MKFLQVLLLFSFFNLNYVIYGMGDDYLQSPKSINYNHDEDNLFTPPVNFDADLTPPLIPNPTMYSLSSQNKLPEAEATSLKINEFTQENSNQSTQENSIERYSNLFWYLLSDQNFK